MKKCSKCKEFKEIDGFYKNKVMVDGLCGYCKNCHNACKKIYSSKTSEYGKKYYSKQKERIIKRNSQYNIDNAEKVKVYKSQYQKENKELCAFKTAKRRAAKLNATLEGYNEELKEIYKNCPEGYHVDHIVPLQNELVCGLHVPCNLQYLTAEDNLKKGNKLIGDLYAS